MTAPKQSKDVDSSQDKSFAHSRRLKQWAVSYSSTVECEYGYKHEVGNILVGLDTKPEAEKKAVKLGGRVKREWFTPPLSDEEISLLNKADIPVKRSPYGLTFEGVAVVFSDSPSSLDNVRQLYKHAMGTDLVATDKEPI